MNDSLLADQVGAGDISRELDRLVLQIRDIPSTCAFVRRLVDLLDAVRRLQMRAGREAAWENVVHTVREHDVGRLLRTDPMARRCQWRAPGTDPYDIVEAFVMSWDDAVGALFEAEQPGQSIHTVFLNIGVGAAVRERRDMIYGYLAALGADSAVLGLGAGRAPEIDLFGVAGMPADVRFVTVDSGSPEDAMIRRKQSSRIECRTEPVLNYLDANSGKEAFDLIYLVDGLDTLDNRQAALLLEKAALLLRPNGKLVLSSFASDLPEAAYWDAILDWRPILRSESDLEGLSASICADGRLSKASWRGGSNRVAFLAIERLSWAA